MENTLKGKVALIPGGTSGIGFAIAKRYVQEGAAVVVCGRNKEKAAKAGKTNIHFIKKDLMELGEKAGSFDAVTAYNVLLYMKNQDQVLRRIHKLLKPGGIFISATDCLARSFAPVAVEKFWKSKMGLMPYVSFESPIGLMRKIQKQGFLVLEIVNLHQNPPNIFIVAQKIEKR